MKKINLNLNGILFEDVILEKGFQATRIRVLKKIGENEEIITSIPLKQYYFKFAKFDNESMNYDVVLRGEK